MPIVYEVPTHLNVSDTILFGLGAHQLVRVVAGGSLAYGLWDQATFLAPEFRVVIAGLVAATGLACAVVHPGGRPLDRWVMAAVLFVVLPRRFVWRRIESLGRPAGRDVSGWAEFSPEVRWVDERDDRADDVRTARNVP
jgi:hypothetical protein